MKPEGFPGKVLEDGMQNSLRDLTPYVVLGIALVVEQLGIGSRMVLRYPTAPLKLGVDDLFFKLPSRQMAKLFRPKPALCGKPMTLSVGGTVFCCYATLMDEPGEASNDEDAATTDTRDHLALFSVIVALAPQARAFSIPISGWTDTTEERADALAREAAAALDKKRGACSEDQVPGSRLSASFLSIRRVHISLARLCRVLEREERRCKYITLQSDLFKRIRSDVHKKWIENQAHKSVSTPKTNISSASSPVSMAAKAPPAPERKGRHRRASSFSKEFPLPLIDRGTATVSTVDDLASEREQEVMEVILAAPPISDECLTGRNRSHNGNLARELAQVYHALNRNDNDFPPSPSDLLTGQSGIVYVNRHIAVAIEPLAPNRGVTEQQTALRPYHALFFPYASPGELLDSLKVSGSTTSQRLQQFLLMVSPRKSLKEAATDANLPYQAAAEIAAFLVSQGACLIAPVLSRSSRLACDHIQTIQKVSLAFSQTFGSAIHLLLLVSYLTKNGWTIGEAMTSLSSSMETEAVMLRGMLKYTLHYQGHGPVLNNEPPSPADTIDDSLSTHPIEPRLAEEIEDLIFQMATWLRSRQVLLHVLEFLVVGESARSTSSLNGYDMESRSNAEKKVDITLKADRASDDALFADLLNSGCLDGNTAMLTCGWKVGSDAPRIRAFALRHPHIRIVSRVPTADDDW